MVQQDTLTEETSADDRGQPRRLGVGLVAALAVLALVVGVGVGVVISSGDPVVLDPDTPVAGGSPTSQPDSAVATDPDPAPDDVPPVAEPGDDPAAPQADGIDGTGTPVPAPDAPAPAAPQATFPPLPGGTWEADRVYAAGDQVTLDGVTYVAEVANAGWVPTPDGHPRGAVGFGQRVTGGVGGEVRTVTSTADSGPGSLRDAVAGDAPKWVRFDVDGPIRPESAVLVGSNTTIDGRGSDVVVTNYGLDIRDGVNNVIVTNLTFADLTPQRHEVDGVRVLYGAHDVWLDHLTLTRINDEAINIGEFSTDVTVSWTHIAEQDRGILVGNHTSHEIADDPSMVTVHHTWFEQVNQRAPRAVRWASVHVFNSLIDRWLSTGASAAQNAQIRSEGNVYITPDGGGNVVITRGGQGRKNPDPGVAASINDLVVGGAELPSDDASEVFVPPYEYAVSEASPALEEVLRTWTGRQDVGPQGPWTPVG